jgi:hypothetical protein
MAGIEPDWNELARTLYERRSEAVDVPLLKRKWTAGSRALVNAIKTQICTHLRSAGAGRSEDGWCSTTTPRARAAHQS